jgi:hypothetical protein
VQVNPTRKKALTNMRASGKDATVVLSEPIVVTLDYALEVRGSLPLPHPGLQYGLLSCHALPYLVVPAQTSP